jgi:tetratricopeptide (TPR) repeat protein
MAFRYLIALTATAAMAAPASTPMSAADKAKIVAVGTALAGSSCMGSSGSGSLTPSGKTVLISGLTPAHMPVSANAEAQAFFDQGLGLLKGFDFDEAWKSFRRAGELDPECAMCGWGEALAIGPYINSGPVAARDIATGRALVAKVLASTSLSPRDRGLAEALLARYEPGGSHWGAHGDVYADMLVKLAARFADDNLVADMAAEAIMAASPWDYWQAGGKLPKGRIGEALTLVENVLARAPNDPQAIHLLIHLTEASAHPERAASAAARLETIAPAAPHMVHMPSHIWYRIGRFDEAIAANQRAIKADEAYARQVGDDPENYGYFNHHSHFIASAATQIEDRATALAAAAGLERAITAKEVAKSPWLEMRLITALHARAHFMIPAEVIALPAPDKKLLRLQMAWHGVRAEALARTGDTMGARGELAALRTARDAIPHADPDDIIFAAIADSVARGRIFEADGNAAEALRQYRAAEAIESNLGYSEPPLWPTPVSVLSGQLRLKMGDSAGAAADFRRALAQRPSNRLASVGLATASRTA